MSDDEQDLNLNGNQLFLDSKLLEDLNAQFQKSGQDAVSKYKKQTERRRQEDIKKGKSGKNAK